MASQMNGELTFFHAYSLMRPTLWTDEVYQSYDQTEKEKLMVQLTGLVEEVQTEIPIGSIDVRYHLENSFVSESAIIDYAVNQQMDFICISRTGMGKSSKIFGSHTSNLIRQSPVPVIAVPPNYTMQPIERICYASDFSGLRKETQQVLEFAHPLGAQVDLLHFAVPSDAMYDQKELQQSLLQAKDSGINLLMENFDFNDSLIGNMDRIVSQLQPSLFVMFTQQNRTFFEKLFLSNISADYSSLNKFPLLVFKKQA